MNSVRFPSRFKAIGEGSPGKGGGEVCGKESEGDRDVFFRFERFNGHLPDPLIAPLSRIPFTDPLRRYGKKMLGKPPVHPVGTEPDPPEIRGSVRSVRWRDDLRVVRLD